MERSSSGQHSCERLKRQKKSRTSRRTFFVRSTEKGPEESTEVVLEGGELCLRLAPRLSILFCLLDRASHGSTPVIRNLPDREEIGAVSMRSSCPLRPFPHIYLTVPLDIYITHWREMVEINTMIVKCVFLPVSLILRTRAHFFKDCYVVGH